MQEFLKSEQDKYIYYYNDNELEQFYFYQQMPENNEMNLNNKQEYFKIIFSEWKLKQINFLLQQITLDIQTYLPEKLNLASSLTEIEIFRSVLNSKEPNSNNNKSIEKANLNDLNSSKNPNLILYNNINNLTLIQGNNSVQINENKNFTNKNSNANNNNNNNNYNSLNLNEITKSKAENNNNNNSNYLNTVSINDICNSCDNNFTKNNYNENSQQALNLATKEIDFSFFSNRVNTEKLISFLLNFLQGIEREMLIYTQEELERNTYLRNESIYFLIDSYNSIVNFDKKQKAESENKSKFISSTNYRKLLQNQNSNQIQTFSSSNLSSFSETSLNKQSFENQYSNACFKLEKNRILNEPDMSNSGSIIHSSQGLNTSESINRKETILSKKDYSLLGKRKSSNQNDKENQIGINSCNTNSSSNPSRIYKSNFKATSLQRNNLSLFPILEDDEIKGEFYS